LVTKLITGMALTGVICLNPHVCNLVPLNLTSASLIWNQHFVTFFRRTFSHLQNCSLSPCRISDTNITGRCVRVCVNVRERIYLWGCLRVGCWGECLDPIQRK